MHLSPALRRPRRTVKYANPDHMFPGTAGLPIQWNSWLSFTRTDPPTLEELQADVQRMNMVKANALLIAERDRAEQAQQQLQAPNPQAPDVAEEIAPPEQTTQLQEPETKGAPDPWVPPPASDQPESWTPRASVRRGA
ncbi:hypothetical protein FS837_003269 [Tulasnella sp. UAMH 9824]|nr:hypothetical protein FS837_003269 [Tulasnella sp. UAMH 9824]